MKLYSRKPNKIPRDLFKLRKRTSQEETKRNRFFSERLNVKDDPLLSILTSLETKATTENNGNTKETIEADFLEEFQSHTRGT